MSYHLPKCVKLTSRSAITVTVHIEMVVWPSVAECDKKLFCEVEGRAVRGEEKGTGPEETGRAGYERWVDLGTGIRR